MFRKFIIFEIINKQRNEIFFLNSFKNLRFFLTEFIKRSIFLVVTNFRQHLQGNNYQNKVKHVKKENSKNSLQEKWGEREKNFRI